MLLYITCVMLLNANDEIEVAVLALLLLFLCRFRHVLVLPCCLVAVALMPCKLTKLSWQDKEYFFLWTFILESIGTNAAVALTVLVVDLINYALGSFLVSCHCACQWVLVGY